MSTNQRALSAAILGSLVLNGLVLFVLRGSFGHWFIAMVLAIYIGGPALLVAAGAYLLPERFVRSRRVWRGAAVVGVVSASTVISVMPGDVLAKRDIEAAEKHCESLIPGIDEYHRTQGAYPLSPSLIPGTTEMSRIGQQCAYWSDGAKFGFNLGDPRGIMSFIGYDSSTHRWYEWH